MPVPHVLIRRVLVAPLILLAEALIVVASPLLAVIAAIACGFVGDLRPLRVLAIALSYCVRHIACTAGCLGLWVASGFGRSAHTPRMQHAYYGLLRWFVGGVSHTVLRMARVEVVHTGSEAAEAVLAAGGGPVVVLSRHAGEGDTLLVLHQLLCAHGRRPRVVLHELLRLDPLIDVFGHRLPNRFVDPRGGDTEVEIAAMAQDAGALDAVLIFPEGGNFSPERRQRGIERLEQAGHDEEAAWAREMRHVSAPRPGGRARRAGGRAARRRRVPRLRRRAVRRAGAVALPRPPQRVELRLWHVPAGDVPAEREQRIDWLFGWWRTLDAWVARAQPTSK